MRQLQLTLLPLFGLLAVSAAGSDVALQPELVVQQPPRIAFTEAVLSPDRKLVVTVGQESSGLRVWELETGLLIRPIAADTGFADPHKAKFLDARRFLVAATRGEVTLYNLLTGAILRRFAPPPFQDRRFVKALLPREDGSQFAVAWRFRDSERGWVILYDADSGRVLASREIGFEPNFMARADQNSFWVIGSPKDNRRPAARLAWSTGAVVEASADIGYPEASHHYYGGQGLVVAADEQSARRGELSILDARTHAKLRTLEHKEALRPETSRFVDADTLLSCTTQFVFLWNARTGDIIDKIKVRELSGSGSPPGLRLPQALLDEGGGILLLDTARYSAEGRALEQPDDLINSIDFEAYWARIPGQPDRMRLGFRAGSRPAHDLHALAVGYLGEEVRGLFPHIRFSPTRRYVAQVIGKQFAVWDLSQGRGVFKRLLPKRTYSYRHVVFSPDERHVAFVPGSFWTSVPPGERREDYEPDRRADMLTYVYSLPDGQQVAQISQGDSAGESILFQRGAFSPAARMLALSSDTNLALVDYDSWAVRKLIKVDVTALGFDSPSSLVISSDNGTFSQVVLPWGTVNRDIARSDFGAAADIRPSVSGRMLTTRTLDGIVEVWSLPQMRKVLTTALLPERNWIHFTPDGHFDSSADGGRYATWNVAGRIYAFEQFEKKFRGPQLIKAVLTGAPPPAAPAAGTLADHVRRSLPPDVTIVSPGRGARIDTATTDVRLEASSTRGIERVDVFVNGRKVDGSRDLAVTPTAPGANRVSLLITVPVREGANKIEAIAWDVEGTSSRPSVVEITRLLPETIKPELWILAVGISDYPDTRFKLGYAAADGRSIAAAFAATATGLFRQVHQRVLTDANATRTSILEAFDKFLSRADERDVVVLIFAGHGVRDSRLNYYFLTHDAQVENLRASALRWSDLENAVKDLAVKKVLLFADTCHSGAVVGDGRLRAAPSDELVADLVKGQGVLVLTSSTGAEVSREGTQWASPASPGHGVFTYALLRGLDGEADVERRGVITVFELMGFVSRKVRELTGGQQHPTAPRLERFVDFPIAMVAGAGSRR